LTRRPAFGPGVAGILLAVSLSPVACGPAEVDLTLRPDSVLRAELGLTDSDRVHRVTLLGGDTERIDPPSLEVEAGDWVEFVTGDWRIHEVRFDADSLTPAARDFLEGSDQMDSPPMVRRDERFVVSFAEAPEGRYPFTAAGNGAADRGVVVVVPRR
jgi:plastocyanin